MTNDQTAGERMRFACLRARPRARQSTLNKISSALIVTKAFLRGRTNGHGGRVRSPERFVIRALPFVGHPTSVPGHFF